MVWSNETRIKYWLKLNSLFLRLQRVEHPDCQCQLCSNPFSAPTLKLAQTIDPYFVGDHHGNIKLTSS